ncbi:MAG: site-specific DNA-methyltransferase [Candidatus Peregrinibacteria bacterium]|nr:site-specific DNA-methyltransferase [Candidatus Peregrinibacteria bacterium]
MKKSKMNGKSLNPQEELLELLKQKFPEIFAEGKVDCQKLKQTLGEEVDLDSERYGMAWAGKSSCFRVIQEPTTATLKPAKDESVDFDKTENLFIEGDNLEVLKVLQKSYYGKVKMIYIDPPYNTGNDFVYNDDFRQNKDEYQQEAGIKDDSGNLRGDGLMKNTSDRGHYHSDWLNMMYPRLFLARNLLKQDGLIFVSIDENESHNLKILLNEIFGEENFVSEIVWEKRFTRSNNAKMFATLTERILLYRRSDEVETLREPRNEKADSTYSNPDNDSRGVWTSVSYVNPALKEARPNLSYDLLNPITKEVVSHPTNAWKYSKETYKTHIKEDRLYWGIKGGNTYPRLKKFLTEMEGGMVPVDLWNHKSTGTTDQASKELNELMGAKVFDFPKPTGLIRRMLTVATESEDIVLDFFAGSGTTAHAVMELNSKDGGNRKCISVQLPELCDEKSEAFKSGYKNISDISKERIRRAGKRIKDEKGSQLDLDGNKLDTGFKVFKLDQSNFKIWRTDVKNDEELIEQMNIFVDNVKKESTQDNILYELVLKSGLDLNVDVDKKEADKKAYYLLDGGKLVICLEDKLSQGLVDAILADKPEKAICLDKAFGGNDQLKTNTVLQMEAGKIDFKII